MALEYGPFNGLENAWDAYDFAEYFKLFYGNGVFPNPSNNLQVVTNANMQTKVSVGVGFVEGHKIKNTSEFILQHDVADGVLKRIDRVVMRANFLQNKGEIIVKKGTPASSPVAPTLVRNTDYYELALADVLISNGATVITQANITDQRLNTALCGVVATNIKQLDTTTLALQYQAAFEQMTIDQQQEFETWLDALDAILDENVAATLANRLLAVEGDIGNLDNLTTEVKGSLVEAINDVNYVYNYLGGRDILTTTDKTTYAAAINEVNAKATDLTNRWGKLCKLTTDWNTTIENGLYMAQNATGAPTAGGPGWLMGEVIAHNDLFVNQRIISLTDGIVCREYQRNRIGGTWNAWIETTPQKVLGEIESLKSSVSNGKSQVAAAITGKGVTTAADASFATMATNINQIRTIALKTSGTILSVNSNGSFTRPNGTAITLSTVTVNNLGFIPRNIYLKYTNASGIVYTSIYNADASPNEILIATSPGDDTSNSSARIMASGSFFANSTGFRMPVLLGAVSYSWYAQE